MTSCDFFDIDDEGIGIATEMTLDHDTIYVMQGDTFSIKPVFTPEELTVADLFFLPAHDDVVAVRGDYLEAVGEGTTEIYFGSLSAHVMDTCMVYVMARWTQRWGTWPYETVVYAHVTVGGQPLTEDMEVAAFVGDDCRAMGVQKTYFGIPMVQFRVGSLQLYADNEAANGKRLEAAEEAPTDDTGDDEDDDDDAPDENEDEPDEPEPYREVITFRCYDHRNHRLYLGKPQQVLDGETHGTLSDLFEIAF